MPMQLSRITKNRFPNFICTIWLHSRLLEDTSNKSKWIRFRPFWPPPSHHNWISSNFLPEVLVTSCSTVIPFLCLDFISFSCVEAQGNARFVYIPFKWWTRIARASAKFITVKWNTFLFWIPAEWFKIWCTKVQYQKGKEKNSIPIR